MAQQIENLSAFDWDDSALIEAYEQGVEIRLKELEALKAKEKMPATVKRKWNVGDFCQAVYPDGILYEAKVIAVLENSCIVDFLGYDEELEVGFDALIESRGKKSRKKQIKRVNKLQNQLVSADESASGDDVRNNIRSPMYSRKKKHHHSNHGNQMLNHTVDRTAAESSFPTMYQPPAQFNALPAPSMIVPGMPPMPHCSNSSQDSSLAALMTSWYMAGYYTGLHQVQKNQRCCCRTSQNCCRH